MQAWILKFLLGRGLNWATELAAKAARHGVGVIGGMLIKQGWASADQMTTVEGGALVLVAIAASAARTFFAKTN